MGVRNRRNTHPYLINGAYSPTPEDLDVAPVWTADRAVSLALQDLSLSTPIEELSDWARRVLTYEKPISRLLVWIDQRTSNPHLAWHINIRPNLRDNWYYFLDSKTGEILEKYNATNFDGPAVGSGKDLHGANQPIPTYQVGATYYLLDASRPIWKANQPEPVE